jgi:hypothetical protein
MKKYDFTRFIIDEYGSVETKRVSTNNEKYLIKNIIPQIHDDSGSLYMKYFKSKVFYKNNKTNKFIEEIHYDYNVKNGYFDEKVIIEVVYDKDYIDYLENLLKKKG